eukprot:TRINITY_DN5953_c0_g2_i1.p1 TRINITY_DN5953_c0_g2~~TRINITY_DN5953_c0_g2_i1.p1  ORF type:complete len:1082 (-),score=343.30 TRINITY_DN5953_c0_g2_i1:672-3917(-)
MDAGECVSEVFVLGNTLEDTQPSSSDNVRVLREFQLYNVVSLVAGGGSHFLALTDEGDVFAVGAGPAGQLGLGEDVKHTRTPQKVGEFGTEQIVSICTSYAQSAALTGTGRIFLWGSGHGTAWTPQPVAGIRQEVRISQVAMGSAHVLALGWHGPGGAEESILYAWGDNSRGQLGMGDWEARSTPTPIEALQSSHIKQISCGEHHGVAVSEHAHVFFWGTLIPESYFSTLPAVVEPLLDKNVQLTSCGPSCIFAVAESGNVYSWGVGRHGLLGHGNENDLTLPTLIEALAARSHLVRQIECGSVHCVAVAEHRHADGQGEVFVWGSARHGKLGHQVSAAAPDVLAPIPLEMMRGKRVMQAACGSSFSLLLTVLDRMDERDDATAINLQDALVGSRYALSRKHQRTKDSKGSWESGDEVDFRVSVHLFEKQQVSRPSWCMYCSKFMWGLRRIHFKCTGCGFLVHEKCKDLVHTECIGNNGWQEQQQSLRGDGSSIKNEILDEEEEVRRRWSKAQDAYTDDLRRSITHDSEADAKRQAAGYDSDETGSSSPASDRQHPRPHPFQAAAKVTLPADVSNADGERAKQAARIRAKIASYQKKIQRLEEELQRVLSGGGGSHISHTHTRSGSSSGLSSSGLSSSGLSSSSGTSITASEDLAGGLIANASAQAASIGSDSPNRKRMVKIKLDKNWEVDPKQVTVERVLGEGSSAQVFSGRYRGQAVAIKVFKNKVRRNRLQDFLCEYTIMREMKSKYNIFFYGASLNPNLCLIMELCHRGSVYDMLSNERQALRWSRGLKILLEICRAVNCLHCWSPQIVHRDLKTRNLLLDQNWNLKIADFGLARLNTATFRRNTLSKLRGTYTYCAPEIYFNCPFTAKSDVYSIGIIIWETVVRIMKGRYERPYAEFPELQYDFQIIVQTSKGRRCTIPPQCPESIRQLITACWAAEPDDRPWCAQLIGEIQKLQREYRQNKDEWDALLPTAPPPLTSRSSQEAVGEWEGDGEMSGSGSDAPPLAIGGADDPSAASPASSSSSSSPSYPHAPFPSASHSPATRPSRAATPPAHAAPAPPSRAAPTPEEYFGSGGAH